MKYPDNYTENNNRVEIERNKIKPKKLLAYFVIFLLIYMVFGTARAVLFPTGQKESWVKKIPIIGSISRLVSSSDRQLEGEADGRVNILLLGIGGKNHDGGQLTDTIMLASIDTKNKKAALISIPRDMSVPIEGRGWHKVNNVNAYAEAANPGSGGQAVSQNLSEVLGVPIHYYIRADFEGFTEMIDELGGVTVDVENDLEDYSYPILGNEDNPDYDSRYEHLSIKKGLVKMDGSLALKYARSRHAGGIEGTDFARAKRQQKILEAIKEKMLSSSFLFNPLKIKKVYDSLSDHISTNMEMWELLKLWDIGKNMKKEDIATKVLDNSPSGFLSDYVGEDGAYLLIPKSGNFSDIQYFIKNIFQTQTSEERSGAISEKAKVEVLNGTWINGLAGNVASDLEKYGFEVTRTANCSKQDFEQSVIYDLTYGEKLNSLKILKEKTNANVSLGIDSWLEQEIKNSTSKNSNIVPPDFILIIGDKQKTSANNK